jgi:hypothetical protein
MRCVNGLLFLPKFLFSLLPKSRKEQVLVVDISVNFFSRIVARSNYSGKFYVALGVLYKTPINAKGAQYVRRFSEEKSKSCLHKER